MDALIDLSRPGRYSRVTGRGVDGTRVFEVAITSVDEPIPPRAFVFPRFADHVPLPAPTEITRENRGEVMRQVATLFLHLGLADVSKRGEVEQTIGRPLVGPPSRNAKRRSPRRSSERMPKVSFILGDGGTDARQDVDVEAPQRFRPS